MAFIHSPKIVTNGLILALDVANTKSYPGSGVTWKDISGTIPDGTLYNSPTYNTQVSGVLQFNGTNTSAFFTSSQVYNPISGSTFGCWFNVATTASNQSLLSLAGSGSNNGARIGLIQGLDVQTTYTFTLGGVADYKTSASSSANTWNNFVCTVTGSAAIVYLNGNPIQTLSIGTMTGVPSQFAVGARNDQAAGAWFSGSIASCIFYNRVLSANEIFQNFNATRGRFGR